MLKCVNTRYNKLFRITFVFFVLDRAENISVDTRVVQHEYRHAMLLTGQVTGNL